ncbi:MAG TPA: C4-type zinc ribbon domain-containing protein [Chloroflexota bacterium]
MRKVDPLIELQQLDLALDRARERRHQVVEAMKHREDLDAAAAALAEAERDLRRWEGEQRELELELGRLTAKKEADEARLYAGTVRNPKELEGLAKEVEQQKALVSRCEDRLLACYDEVERARRLVRQQQEAYARAETAWRTRQEALGAERDQLHREIRDLEARRAALVARADPASLRVYEHLRSTKGGIAVVPVHQRTCQGCRISLPVSEEHRARSSRDLVTCQSCGRILYA